MLISLAYPEHFYSAIIDILSDAKNGDQIIANYFVVRKGKQTTSFLHALAMAANRGADVTLLIDCYGSLLPTHHGTEYQSKPLSTCDLDQLCFYGVKVGIFNLIESPLWQHPKNILNWKKFSRRNHNKNFLFNLKSNNFCGLIIGDSQWSEEHFTNKYKGNNILAADETVFEQALDYTQQKLKSKQVAWHTPSTILKNYDSLIPEDKKRPEAYDWLHRNTIFKPSIMKFVYSDIEFENHQGRHGLHHYEHMLIKEAKKSLIYCTPYFAPEKELKHYLAKQSNKLGDRLKVLIGKHDDNSFVTYGATFATHKLSKQGVHISEYQGEGNFHYKDLISDNTTFIKTGNGDGRSRFYNMETGILITDRSFADFSFLRIEKDLQQSIQRHPYHNFIKSDNSIHRYWKSAILPFYYHHL